MRGCDSTSMFPNSTTAESYQEDLMDNSDDMIMSGGSKADARKSNKPIMEKRRRARINNCLNELKGILLEAMRKDPARHSKLEKADILELTTRHLQNIQRNQLAVAMATDPTVLYRFKNGFSECASEVSRYLSKLDGIDDALKGRIANHLSSCVTGLQGVSPGTVTTAPFSGGPFRYPDLPFPPTVPAMFASSPPTATPSANSSPLAATPTSNFTPPGDVNNNSSGNKESASDTPRQSLLGHNHSPKESTPTFPLSMKRCSGDQQSHLARSPSLSPSRAVTRRPSAQDPMSNPLDYSISRNGVKVVKVEPLATPVSSAPTSTPKDSMWRPW